MTVRDFLLHKTQARELCMIRDSGYNVDSVWIDYEDLFYLSKIGNKELKSDEWGELTVVTEHGDTIHVPVHYIDV